METLQSLDTQKKLRFRDIHDGEFPTQLPYLDPIEADKLLHGQLDNGQIIKGLGCRLAWRWKELVEKHKLDADPALAFYSPFRRTLATLSSLAIATKISSFVTGKARWSSCSKRFKWVYKISLLMLFLTFRSFRYVLILCAYYWREPVHRQRPAYDNLKGNSHASDVFAISSIVECSDWKRQNTYLGVRQYRVRISEVCQILPPVAGRITKVFNCKWQYLHVGKHHARKGNNVEEM